MIEREKVVIVGCQLPNVDDWTYEQSMGELVELVDTAQGDVVARLDQKRQQIDRRTFIGKGKIEELAMLVEQFEPDLLIFNAELTPAQSKNIRIALNDPDEMKLIDRTQLILDIFASRAQSREGKLQVELAQMNYLLPRLIGQGTQLSRLGGGIGTRGPGETKLESDRRHIKRRIDEITKQLEGTVAHRDRYRERRKENRVFQVALVGYTNAGKSTIFNRLTDADTYEQDELFATLDPLTRELELPRGGKVLITDTVGFIRDLPTKLVAAFRSTLEEVVGADLILHVIDASNPHYLNQIDTTNAVLEELGASEVPQLEVYNKKDRLTTDFVGGPLLISAIAPEDIETLTGALEDKIADILTKVHVILPVTAFEHYHPAKEVMYRLQENFLEDGSVELVGYMREDTRLYATLKQFEV
ncbi:MULTISPECIES: GTPase HflX [Exiguobacterium]|uniref:GTPase HflX n=1 Tax=Exiguobacterium marinum TaxID=273528 RepID=A0ABY7WY35_9BACL|nr:MULTISPECIES: GTPase HflX [Exiguobacterium]WDH74733.1 GTPase HflX [Exiguobacterium marinum]